VEKGGAGRAVRGMKEMTDLLEVMKEDHDILVDKVGEMTRRNDHLQNLANDKESQFEILKNAADEA
jgi:hypothetical protein